MFAMVSLDCLATMDVGEYDAPVKSEDTSLKCGTVRPQEQTKGYRDDDYTVNGRTTKT